ncbi:hypothetical protein SMMN14_04635 [Sphaerulina musiva]
MLLSRYVFSLAAFGLGLVTAELLDPALPCASDDFCLQPCKDSVYKDFENDITATCKQTSNGPLCDCTVSSDDNCKNVCVAVYAVDYPEAVVTDGYQDNGRTGGCCCTADCSGVEDPEKRKECGGDEADEPQCWLQGRSEPCWLATERRMSKVSLTQDADVEHQYPVQSKSMVPG